ncbi:MAG TPA: hypothetical protein DHU85_03745 [Porphyromonadaceae bacterium]|nr:hypothetical protein [Porphyromonadaceae bacterium]
MKYNLSKSIDRERFKRRCNELFEKRSFVELKDKTSRTLRQNNYLHLIIGYLASEVGVPLEYAKNEYYKKAANGELFIRTMTDPVTGAQTLTLCSSAALTAEEMRISIDRFREWSSSVAGIYLPEAGEDAFLREIEIEIQRNEKYL